MNSNKMTVSVAKIVELLDLKSFNDIDLKSIKVLPVIFIFTRTLPNS